VILLEALLFVSSVHAASFNASWNYRKSSDSPRSFVQSYSYAHAFSFTPQVTSSFGLRYTRSYTGSSWNDSLVPTLSLGINNDIFTLNLSGTSLRRRQEANPAFWVNSWNVNLSSPWLSNKDIVNFLASYGESYSYDTGSPKKVDVRSKTWGITLSKVLWEKLSLNYSYAGTWDKDKLTDATSLNQSHSLSTSFFHNWRNLSFGLSGQFNYSRNSQKSRAGEEGARFIVNVNWHWEEAPPNDVLVEDTVAVVEIGASEVDEISFYIDYAMREPVPFFVRWDIEVSNDGVDWEKVAERVSLPYRFSSPVTYTFVRLTVTDVAGERVEVRDAKFVAYKVIEGKSGTVTYTTENTSYKVNLSLGYAFTRFLAAHYNVSYGKTLPSPGDSSKDFSQSFALSWSKYKRFSLNANLSQSLKESGGAPKTESYSLGLSANSELLDTLTLTSGYTHTLSKTGGRKESSSDNFYLSLDAQIYPDLETRWTNSLNVSGGNKNYSSSINITARLKPQLTCIANYGYDKLWGNQSSWNQKVSAVVSWRVSDILSLSASEDYTWNSDGEEFSTFSFSTGIIFSDKIQTNFGLNGNYGKERMITHYFTISWGISRHLALRFSYSGTRKEDGGNPWNWMLIVTANF